MNAKPKGQAIIGIATLILAAMPYVAAATNTTIHDNLGHTWHATATGLKAAFSALQTNGELWIPAGTYTISSGGLAVSKDSVSLYDYSASYNTNYGVMQRGNPSSSE